MASIRAKYTPMLRSLKANDGAGIPALRAVTDTLFWRVMRHEMGLDVATATSMPGDLIRRILRLPPPVHGAASAPCRTAALRRAEGDTHEDPDGSDARCRTSRPPPRDRPHDAGTRGRCRAHDGIMARTEGGPCRPPLPAAPAWCGPRSAPHHGVRSRYGHPSARPRARDLFLLQVLPRSHSRATRHIAGTYRGRASRRDYRRSNLLRVHAPLSRPAMCGRPSSRSA